MVVDEYFLCRFGWKSQGSGKGYQCICMHILLARYIVNVEVSKSLRHVDGCVVIGHQVFMSDFVLPTNLIDDKF